MRVGGRMRVGGERADAGWGPQEPKTPSGLGAQNDGLYQQDWHIEDSPAAEMAFRRGAVRLTLGRPWP